jgi:carboxyl-terminal processing protease
MALLEPFKRRLDDELLNKEATFLTFSMNIYRKRLQTVDSIIQRILAKPLDFSKPDNIVWPPTDYAANDQELVQRWQRYLKWGTLNGIADELPDNGKSGGIAMPPEFGQLEATTRQEIKQQQSNSMKNFLRTPAIFVNEMEEAYLNMIAWCYDPHSSYMNMSEKKEFETEMSASEYSVGFDLEENEEGDLTIGFLQPGGSAWRSGKLHSGDVLLKIKINGMETDAKEISPERLEGLLSGNSGADVEITIRTAAGEEKTVLLAKEKITDDESIVKSYVLRGKKNIGYINLPGFYSRENENIKSMKDLKYDGSANDVSKEIVKLRKDSIHGLILDLRYNGGGSMWEAMQLAGIFIDIGPVASVKEKSGKVHFLKDPNRGTIYDGPMIVLINSASASASEFLSAALQDYNRAVIVGGNTYGKGTAQTILPMDTTLISMEAFASSNKTYEDFVKTTGQKFYRINGSTTQWQGVIPDIVLPDEFSGDIYKEKANSSALQPDNSRTGIYQPLPALPLQELRSKSERRVQESQYFKTINTFNSLMKQYRSSRNIPLTWADYISHYRKTMEMFKLAKDDEEKVLSITVSNNAFDKERINLSDSRRKEINEVYLKQVQTDDTVDEAYKILMDWLGK